MAPADGGGSGVTGKDCIPMAAAVGLKNCGRSTPTIGGLVHAAESSTALIRSRSFQIWLLRTWPELIAVAAVSYTHLTLPTKA